FPLYERLAANSVTPLFDISQIVSGVAFQKAQLFGQRDAVNHARRAALLVERAARIQLAVLYLALKRVPLPLFGVADTDRVDMAVEQNDLLAVAHAADDRAIAVNVDGVKAQLHHLFANTLANFLDVTIHAGNGNDLA